MKKGFYRETAQPLAREFAPVGERRNFARGVMLAVEEFEQHFVFDGTGKLVRGVYKNPSSTLGPPYEVGAHLRPRKGRRPRRIPIMSHRKSGRPRNWEIRLLVGRLGFLIAEVTGETVDSYSWDDVSQRTPFESMLETIFQELRPILVQMSMGGSDSPDINYARNWVKDFVAEKAR